MKGIDLGFPTHYHSGEAHVIFQKLFPGDHVVICSYMKEANLHVQCKCGDTHDIPLLALLPALESTVDPTCWCGLRKDEKGSRCYACPDKE